MKEFSLAPANAQTLVNAGIGWTNMGYSSTRRLVLEYQLNDYKIQTCDLSGDAGTPCINANLASVAPAQLLFEFIEGDTIFAHSNSGTTGWGQEYVIDAAGNVKLFRSQPSAHVDGTCSDGKNLTWTETHGSVNPLDAQTLTEVWSAPLTSDPTVLANTAKKVAVLPKPSISNDVVCANGYYAWGRSDLYIIRLSDRALVSVPWLGKFQKLIYVTDAEVWDRVELPMGDAGAIGNAIMRFTIPAWP